MQHEPESNSDISNQLADHLTGVAATSSPGADWSDLTDRITASHRRRQRFLAGTAVVAALATGAAGFGLGHNGRDSVTMTSEVAGPGQESPKVAAADSPVMNVPGASAPAGSETMSSPGSYMPMPMKRLIARRTESGLEIRSWSVSDELTNQLSPPFGLGVVPPECITTGSISMSAFTENDAAQNGIGTNASTDTQVSLMSSNLNGGDGYVLFVVVEKTAAARIEMRTPDGGTDSVAPQDATAILALKVRNLDGAKDTVVTSVAADGTRKPLAATSTMIFDPNSADPAEPMPAIDTAPQIGPDCTPQLPAPGEQPADPITARAEVTAAFNRFGDTTASVEDRIAVLDDGTGVADAIASAKQFGQEITRTFTDLVFTSPETATIQFEQQMSMKSDAPAESGVSSPGSFPDFGQARLVGGRRVITQKTVCRAMSCDGTGDLGVSAPAMAPSAMPTVVPPAPK